MRMSELLRPTHPIHLLAGLTIWLIWFCALYAGLSLACQWAPPPPWLGPWTWVNGVLGLLSLVSVALLLWAALRCWRGPRAGRGSTQPRRFIAAVSAGLYLLAAIATLAVSATLLLFPPCLQ